MSTDFIWQYSDQNLGDRQKSLSLKEYQGCLIIGVGGVGSWIAFNAALTGCFKEIIIYDYDIVEASNLNRTPFKISHIGKTKVKAIQELILERRIEQVLTVYDEKYDPDHYFKNHGHIRIEKTIVFDCRDNIFKDLEAFNGRSKVWKLGYDGMELTIDGDPLNRAVFGEGDGYTVTPSFVCPSQLIANMAICHSVMPTWFIDKKSPDLDRHGMFKGAMTFDCGALIPDLLLLQRIRDKYKKKKLENSNNKEVTDDQEIIESNNLDNEKTEQQTKKSKKNVKKSKQPEQPIPVGSVEEGSDSEDVPF